MYIRIMCASEQGGIFLGFLLIYQFRPLKVNCIQNFELEYG